MNALACFSGSFIIAVVHRMKKAFSPFVLLILFSGCASVPQERIASELTRSPKDGEVLIYIFRPNCVPFAATGAAEVDGKRLGTLKNKGIVVAEVPRASKQLRISGSFLGVDPVECELSLDAETRVFYLYSIGPMDFRGGMVVPGAFVPTGTMPGRLFRVSEVEWVRVTKSE